MRTCKRCGVHRPLADFPGGPRGFVYTICKPCSPQYQTGGKPERAHKRRWTAANAEKRAAHKAVERALARGELTRQPCERCGAANANAHHDDYSRPLAVMWLCQRHHAERHKEIGRPFGAKVRRAA